MSEIPDSNRESDVAASWREVFDAAEPGLRAFLRSRLTQDTDVDDCLQVVFVKLIESGQNVAPAARRAWLFRVAANESARIWRSRASTDKMLQKHPAEDVAEDDPTQQAILSETTQQLREALDQLPDSWQQVVRLRINQNLTFQQIAEKLDIPIGTALTRMRRALERLKSQFESDDPT
jgi:RNA polymerase sigma-70 factor (ECF subfamily)